MQAHQVEQGKVTRSNFTIYLSPSLQNDEKFDHVIRTNSTWVLNAPLGSEKQ
jgi:hypothetical protein